MSKPVPKEAVSPEPAPNVEGVLVTDENGRVLFSAGAARDPRIQELAADGAWMAEARKRRLQSLALDRRAFTVLVTPLAAGDLILIGRPPSDAVLDFLGAVDFAYDILDHLVNDRFDAMTVVDAEGRIVFISPVHEAFFGLSRGEASGRPAREIIENTRLDKVVRTGVAEIGEIQRMKGAERVVSRVPIKRDGKVVGAVGRVMFKGPQQVEALSRRIRALEGELEYYRREAEVLRGERYGLESLVGDSAAMRRLREQVIKVAPLEIPVLISGESGTGKELVAHALHRLSSRRDAPLVTVNAAALPATLVESELFGYEPGAFTGADRKGRRGKFEQADGGTIFLDEIGDMPGEVQAKLLRVLQDRMVDRIGARRPREVDFRLITATNRDLRALIDEGRFRLDLYYRISPIVIEVPPLRQHVEDIPALVAHFLADIARRNSQPVPAITDGALGYLAEQTWPGNVRQLRHEIERAFVFAENRRITTETLVEYGDGRAGTEPRRRAAGAPESAARSLKEEIGRTEDEMIRAAMQSCGGNKKKVAQMLGISRSYLYKKLKLSG